MVAGMGSAKNGEATMASKRRDKHMGMKYSRRKEQNAIHRAMKISTCSISVMHYKRQRGFT